MYIMTGIDRIPVSERLELLPSLVKDISKHNNTHHQRTLFNILLRLLLHFKPPPRGSAEDTALREKLGFLESSRHHDAKWLSEWFAKLMLLDMGVFTGACSGLSTADVEFLTMGGEKETFMPFSVLADYKFAALRFVGSGAFTDAERYFVVLIASTDTGAATAEPADDVFKRAMSSVSLEDEEIVNRLYFLLLGDSEVPHTKLTLQIKILGLLSKSLKAIVDSKQKEIVDIFKLGLKTTHPKLRQAAFGFMGWVSRMSNDSLVHSLAPGAVEELRYWLLANTAASDDLRGYAYESLSLLTSRCVHIALEPQLDIIRFMFRQLKLDRGGVISSIEDALGVMLTKFAREKLNIQVKEALEDLLLEVIVEENRGVGQAVKWVGRLLGFGSVVGRWAATLAIGIGGTVAEEGGKGELTPIYNQWHPVL
jgi:proteasome component ECM29